jgi:hypothetical protein
VAADNAGNQVEFRCQAKLTAPVLNDLARPDHLVQLVFEQHTRALPFEPELR